MPVEVIEHELPIEERVCPDCGCVLHKMGENVREELKIIPAKAVIVRHVRHVYACRHCMEGINSRIQEIKRRGRGFRNISNFISMIYLEAAGLPMPSYHYPL